MSYVYTLEAARSRLRRGHKSVLVFEPGTGILLKFMKSNWKKMANRFRDAEEIKNVHSMF